MAEYGSMFLVSALAAILFFGGWHGPIPIFQAVAYAPDATEFSILGALANVAGVANLLLKGTVGVIFMMWVRWSFPRLRIDQVITMCWKYCVPISAVAFVGSVFFWQYAGLPTGGDIIPFRSPIEVRESWVRVSDEVETPLDESTSEQAKLEAGESVEKPVAEEAKLIGGLVR